MVQVLVPDRAGVAAVNVLRRRSIGGVSTQQPTAVGGGVCGPKVSKRYGQPFAVAGFDCEVVG
ncbi:MAG: hypothetical protein M3N95_13780 [Actinomycetota bacterium]|nr:hypothetical protein [Actinomycetota bacterium]